MLYETFESLNILKYENDSLPVDACQKYETRNIESLRSILDENRKLTPPTSPAISIDFEKRSKRLYRGEMQYSIFAQWKAHNTIMTIIQLS